MAKTTKTAKTGNKSKTGNGGSAVAERAKITAPAFSYADRVPIMIDELAQRGGSAPVAELHKVLKSDMFREQRRLAATVRYTQKIAPSKSPALADTLETSRGVISLTARGKKLAARMKISRKRTKTAA